MPGRRTHHPVLAALAGTLEALMRLGFPRSDVSSAPFFRVKDAQVGWTVTQRGRRFHLPVGRYEIDSAVHLSGAALENYFQEKWTELAMSIAAGDVPQATLDDFYDRCPARMNPEKFLAALGRAGLRPPVLVNTPEIN